MLGDLKGHPANLSRARSKRPTAEPADEVLTSLAFALQAGSLRVPAAAQILPVLWYIEGVVGSESRGCKARNQGSC